MADNVTLTLNSKLTFKLTNKEQADLMTELKAQRKEGEDGNRSRFSRMRKAENFKVGKQWDQEVLNWNKSKRKHCVTVNRCLPTVNQIVGVQIQNPKDISALNRKGGSATVAKILTATTKHAIDESHGQFEQTHMFDDGVTTAVGYLRMDIDFTHDPLNGNTGISKLNPFRVYPDPNCDNYDLNKGGKYIFYDEWVDKEKIEAEYPHLKDKLINLTYGTDDDGVFSRIVNYFFNQNSKDDDGYDSVDQDRAQLDRTKNQYRMAHHYHKKWVECVILVDSQNPFDFVRIVDKKDIKQTKEAIKTLQETQGAEERFEIKETTCQILCYSKTIGDVLVDHDRNMFNENGANDKRRETGTEITMFPIVPFYPYYVNGYAFGVIENIIGPQEEENWAHSAAINLMKTLANTGYMVKTGMGKAMDWLKAHGGEDGIVIDKSKFGGAVDKIEPTPVSTGHIFFSEKASENIAEISATRLENPEFDKKNQSGRAIALKQNASMTGKAIVFRNYDYSIELFATLLISVIRYTNIYTEQEIREILDREDLVDKGLLDQATTKLAEQGIVMPPPPSDIEQSLQVAQVDPTSLNAMALQAQEELETYQAAQGQFDQLQRTVAEQIMFSELRNLRKGRYSIKVDQSASSPTMRIAGMAELIDIAQLFPPGTVPAEILLNQSDIQRKEEAIEAIKQREQLMLQAAQSQGRA